ncbi:MutH/Sau3AI family endonuclease [Malacoplasma iowae]|uniref:MutH/Sau3AI family endonuclease n=1 Tax=Malacoplasma iowae TaxID=2116 RepID=UPI003873A112|nr:MutH/Sau3AI family endonuclease [Malacoplasma iowae]
MNKKVKEWMNIFFEEIKKDVEGKTLASIMKYKNYQELNLKDKGNIGNFIQEVVFNIERNNSKEYDIKEYGIEIKVTPIKKNTNDNYSSKERLVCNVINYNEIISESDFYNSSFIKKNRYMLLCFYLFNNDIYKSKILKLSLIDLISLNEIVQIEKDYEVIKNKVVNGFAHEISGSDTLILEACTKGSKKSIFTTQPNNLIKAKRRAYALKSKFVTKLFFESFNKNNCILMLNTPNDVIYEILKYKGWSISNLCHKFNVSNKSKSFRFKLILGILGCKHISKVPGISSYDISVKTITLEKNNNLVESIPLIKVDNSDICNDFYDSSFYYEISKPIMFVIFKKNLDNIFLHDVIMVDLLKHKKLLENAKIVYEDTKNIYENGSAKSINSKKNLYNFKKISDNLDFHIRPKASNKDDTYITPFGEKITKQAFWLNNSTFLEIYNKNR